MYVASIYRPNLGWVSFPPRTKDQAVTAITRAFESDSGVTKAEIHDTVGNFLIGVRRDNYRTLAEDFR